MSVTALITANVEVTVTALSSIGLSGNLKWQADADTPESWDGIVDQSTTWTTQSETPESWTELPDESTNWTPVAEESTAWN
jgi:hypothetical protein